MSSRYACAIVSALLMVDCGMNGPYTGGTHPAETDPIDSGDSAAVVAILKANGLSDTLMRHIVTVRDTRVVVLDLIETDYTYDYLPDSSIFTIPDEIGGLGALETLNVWDQAVQVLPKGIGGLTSVRRIFVTRCPLEGIANEISKCTSLTELYLFDNAIETLPDSLPLLPALRVLGASDNAITALPFEVGRLSRLRTLNLSNNSLAKLPESITLLGRDSTTNPPGTFYLDLSNNSLCDLPDSIGAWADTYDPDWRESQTCK